MVGLSDKHFLDKVDVSLCDTRGISELNSNASVFPRLEPFGLAPREVTGVSSFTFGGQDKVKIIRSARLA